MHVVSDGGRAVRSTLQNQFLTIGTTNAMESKLNTMELTQKPVINGGWVRRIRQNGSKMVRQWGDLSRAALHQADSVFPGHQMTQGDACSRISLPNGVRLESLRTRRGEKVAALYAPATQLAAAGKRPMSVLFFYGNDMCLGTSQPILNLLRRLGVNVLMPEFVGYGMSEGKPSERGCYATADAAWRFLQRQPDVDPKRIIVGGCSMGGAVGIDLASRVPVAGLATLVTFTSIPDMAARFFPKLLVRLLCRYQFANEPKIGRVHCPILIGHSTGDLFVPYEMSDRLAAAAGGPVSRLKLDSADHNTNSMLSVAAGTIGDALRRFVQTCDAAVG